MPMRRMSVVDVSAPDREALVLEQPGELARAQERMLQVQLVEATHEGQDRTALTARGR